MDTKTPIRLEQWAITGNPYRDPEAGGQRLSGEVYGDPRACDGKRCLTSPIAAVDGRVITTMSGTRYVLGEPAPEYLWWLNMNNIAFDPENPIRKLAQH